MVINEEEKKIILRRKPLPKYYISLKSMFPSVYLFIKRDLIKILKKEDFDSDVIYDYKNDDFWVKEDFFNRTQDIYVGYIQNETFDSYCKVIKESSVLTEHLYNQFLLIRSLSLKELLSYKRKYKKEKEDKFKIIYDYCKYELISRIIFVKLVNRFIFLCKFVPRCKYQNIGKNMILKKISHE